ncbi:putative aspartyl protease [Iris pallida]|uniref:Aspartyl protease n=1 Tax=Iris pallida TaxID=29817 RepID=A0AAX6I1J9_IRIPA|nr:putative aspartyl protease [Iris pallida]
MLSWSPAPGGAGRTAARGGACKSSPNRSAGRRSLRGRRSSGSTGPRRGCRCRRRCPPGLCSSSSGTPGSSAWA